MDRKPESLDRLARNQALFREVNERVEDMASGRGPVEFLCECSRTDCIETIELTVAEYEQVRADSARFVIKTGHDLPEIERVVARHVGWVVVEKVKGVEVVTEMDPREISDD